MIQYVQELGERSLLRSLSERNERMDSPEAPACPGAAGGGILADNDDPNDHHADEQTPVRVASPSGTPSAWGRPAIILTSVFRRA